MNRWKFTLIGVLLIFAICMPLASSDLLIARQIPAAKMDVTAAATVASKLPTSPSEKMVVNEPSTHISINAMPANEFPLSVTKSIVEPNKKDYFVDKPVRILVQITCLGGKSVDDIRLWEHTDKNLPIIECKKYIRSSSVNDTIDPEKSFYNNYIFDSMNNLIYIPIKNMYSKESVLYEYVVKPKKAGIYKSYTVVRIPSNYPIFSDYLVPLEIEAMEERPEFQVALDVRKLELECGENLSLRYIIKYLGGASGNPCRYNVNLSQSESYTLSKMNFTDQSFDQHNNTLIDSIIKYSEEGTYSLPTIMIDGQYYMFDENIKVIKGWRKYIEDIGLSYVTFLLFLATLGLVIVEWDKSQKIQNSLVSHLPKIIIFIIIFSFLLAILIILR